jgi:hypothetical protein
VPDLRKQAVVEVSQAIGAGELPLPSEYECCDCGRPATEYDHRDYEQPLLVDPVCGRCNSSRGPGSPYPEITIRKREARFATAAARAEQEARDRRVLSFNLAEFFEQQVVEHLNQKDKLVTELARLKAPPLVEHSAIWAALAAAQAEYTARLLAAVEERRGRCMWRKETIRGVVNLDKFAA